MNEETYQTFDRYLANEMTTEEKLNFEQQLQNDTNFKANFSLYQETTQFLQHKFSNETLDFKTNLKSISAQHFETPTASKEQNKTKVIAFKPWHYAVAASIVVLLGTWFMMQGNPSYSDYNQHENAVFLERGQNDELLKQAQESFNAKNYKQSVKFFQQLGNNATPEMNYFYSIALIETNDYAKAERLLNELKNGTSVYKEKAIWYLALSNLKQNKIEACAAFLKQIPADAEDYEKAQELLHDVE